MAQPGTPQDRAAFDRVLALREQGRRAEAARECQAIVQRAPGFAPALHLLGVMALEENDLERAARFLPAAVRADPADPSVHHSLGLLFRAARKPADAVVAFRAAARLDPGHVAALNGLGLSLLDLRDAAGAEQAFDAALRAHPAHAQTLHNRGLALEAQRRMEEAEQSFRAALEADPALAPARFALGRALLMAERAAEAEAVLRECVVRQPQWADARAALAMALEAQFRDAEAEALLRQAPDPEVPAIAMNLANRLARAGRHGEALEIYDRFAARHPRDPVSRHNRANALAGLGRIDEAMAGWREAIALSPASADPHFALSRWLLSRGELEAGWTEFAWRPLELPQWLPRSGLTRAGDPAVVQRVRGERAVELVEEQGLGDVIFFLQWAPWLVEQGVRVMLRVSGRLSPLLARLGPFEIRERLDAPLGDDRVAIPFADLPQLVMAMGGPARCVGTLRAEPLPDRLQAARQALTEAGPAPYTGLTWRAGVPRRGVARDMLSKNVEPELLWKSLDAPGTLVAMQRGPREGELEQLRRFAPCVADFSSWTDDLESLLGLLAALDGYAGVSNTNIHLLALLGRHATVAVPHPPEWRWGTAGGSQWFPGFRVVRQGAGESWEAAFTRGPES